MVPAEGGLSGADDDDDDELVASMRASRHTRTEYATLATHYSIVAFNSGSGSRRCYGRWRERATE